MGGGSSSPTHIYSAIPSTSPSTLCVRIWWRPEMWRRPDMRDQRWRPEIFFFFFFCLFIILVCDLSRS